MELNLHLFYVTLVLMGLTLYIINYPVGNAPTSAALMRPAEEPNIGGNIKTHDNQPGPFTRFLMKLLKIK